MEIIAQLLDLLQNPEIFDLVGQIYRAGLLLGAFLGPLFAALFG